MFKQFASGLADVEGFEGDTTPANSKCVCTCLQLEPQANKF